MIRNQSILVGWSEPRKLATEGSCFAFASLSGIATFLNADTAKPQPAKMDGEDLILPSEEQMLQLLANMSTTVQVTASCADPLLSKSVSATDRY